MSKIYIASDHAAFNEKNELKKTLISKGYELMDLGPETGHRCHYPDYATKVARALQEDPLGLGLLLCGSGIGVSMVANRYKGIRAALCRSKEDAELSRQHNNANILCLGVRFNSLEKMEEILLIWLETEFEGGRHEERINLFDSLGES